MLFSKLILILLSSSCGGTGNRLKRVINGDRVEGRTGPYDAVQYTVGMASRHGSKWYTFGFRSFLKKTGIYGKVNCGGALLTPSVVQTACHCVAYFDKDPANKNPVLHNHWEGLAVVYIGLNDRFGDRSSETWMTRSPANSVKFFTTQKCQKWPIDNISESDVVFDMGYIVLNPAWIDGSTGVPTATVKFAPIYTTAGLSQLYTQFLKAPPVCLNLGWGGFDDRRHTSPFLRSGWTHLMDDLECQKYTAVGLSPEYRSWVCAQRFTTFYQPADHGDSGGPFTCNNAYFGVQGAYIPVTYRDEGTRDVLLFYRINQVEALVFAVFENALEWRSSFEAELRFYVQNFLQPTNIARKLTLAPSPNVKNIVPKKHQPDSTSRQLLSQGVSAASSAHIHSLAILINVQQVARLMLCE